MWHPNVSRIDIGFLPGLPAGEDEHPSSLFSQAPSGYVVLGDIITQGGELPRHHSVCLAKDSDLASTPLGYRLVLEELGLWVWEPDPPEGCPPLCR